jgi:hypothetical protein
LLSEQKIFKDNDFKNENEFKYFNLYETNENGEIIEKNLDVYSEKINKILNGDKKKKLKEDINLIIEYKKKLKIDLNPNKNSFPLKNLNENEEIKNYLKTNQIGAINFFEKNIIEKNIKNNLLIGGPGSGKTIVFLITSIIILNNIKNSKIINNKNCKMVVNLINNNSNVEMQKFYFNIINEGIYENLIYEKQLYDIKDIKNIIFNKKNYEEIDFLSEDVNFIVNKDKFWC